MFWVKGTKYSLCINHCHRSPQIFPFSLSPFVTKACIAKSQYTMGPPRKEGWRNCGCHLFLLGWLIEKCTSRDFLVVQCLRIHLAMQKTWIRSLVGETKIPHAMEKLSPCATITEAHKLWSPQTITRESLCAAAKIHTLQLSPSPGKERQEEKYFKNKLKSKNPLLTSRLQEKKNHTKISRKYLTYPGSLMSKKAES